MKIRISQSGGARVRLFVALAVEALSLLCAGPALATDPPAGCSTVPGVTTCVFAHTGSAQSWTVPDGVTSVVFDVNGAQGGTGHAGTGGPGGRAFGTAAVTPGTIMQIHVGGRGADEHVQAGHQSPGGWNGGAEGFDNGGGGGGSDVRVGSCAATLACGLAARLIVAGGGGGGGGNFGAQGFSYGGYGGGEDGAEGDGYLVKAGGGTAIAGGTAGNGFTGCPSGAGGVLGQGGAGSGFVAGSVSIPCWGGGGGGGGYFGGGGAGGMPAASVTGFGGGGGSGFVDPGLSNPSNISGVRSGNGLVTITFAGPFGATINKNFGASSIALNSSTSLTFTLDNPNASRALTGVAFTDPLPAGLVVATPSALTGSCGGGTITAVAGSSSVALSGATLAANTSCIFSVMVTGTVANEYTNVTSAVTASNAPPGIAASANLSVVNPLTIAKHFGDPVVPLNGTTTLTFSIRSGSSAGLTGLAFTDNLQAGLVVSATPAISNTCGGTVVASAGASSVQLSAGSLAALGSCTVVVNVTGTTAGLKHNTVQVSATGVTGTTSSDDVLVTSPPVIAKSFGAPAIPLNGSTSLSFTIQNNNPTLGASQVSFSDTLPPGLVIATPNGLTGFCGGGSITATENTNVVSLTAAGLGPADACTFSINVTGTAAGLKQNITSNVTSSNGTGGPASANVTVQAAPSIAKAFNPLSIPLNATTTLTFTINNPVANLDPLSGVAFTDSLPPGLAIATPNGLTGSCGGGTITATENTNVVSLTGGTVAVSSACTFSINVTGTSIGLKQNVTGNVTSANAGTGGTASASVKVQAPPTIAKAFSPLSIPVNGTTMLTFTIGNPAVNVDPLSGVAFTDTLPPGLVIATPNGLTGSCGGGTITATQNSNVVNLTGGTLPLSGACTFSINVTGTSGGLKHNTTGNVTSTNGGTGGTASADVNVLAPPSIAKAFSPTAIEVSATTSLTFTITNPASNTDPLSGVAFTDTLPAGLTVASASTSVCGGTLTTTAPTGIALSGATIATNSQCQFSVTVTGAALGPYTNITGNVTSTNGGTGNVATANVAVVAVLPPTISQLMGDAGPAGFSFRTLLLNSTRTLTFTVQNANSVAVLPGLAFTDSLPAGLAVSATPAVTNTCGGIVSASGGASSIQLAGGGPLQPGTSCAIGVNVTATTAGYMTNSVQASYSGGTGNTSDATYLVLSPPVIAKAFEVPSIALNGSTRLSFTISNINPLIASPADPGVLLGVGFSDTLPAGLVIATPNGLTGSCASGTITATQNTNVVSLAGATLSGPGACTFSVNVTGTSAGLKQNVTGNVTSANAGTGGTASASVKVQAPPTIAKAFSPLSIPVNGTTMLSFTIGNPVANVDPMGGVAFTDTLPPGLVIATPNGLTGSCGGGTITAVAGSGNVALSGATLPANSSCTFSVMVTGTVANHYTNTTSAVTSANGPPGNFAVANLTVGVELNLDIDASNAPTRYDALTDGLLIVRYLLGVTGPELTNGVLGSTATRSSAMDIVSYLDAIRPALDIDRDGNAEAMTDGLLIVRYMFGWRGGSLVVGAVGPAATRTAAEIEAYLQSLMP